MMLRCVIVKIVELVDLLEMRKTDSFGETRLVPHVPAHHELESVFIIIIIIINMCMLYTPPYSCFFTCLTAAHL